LNLQTKNVAAEVTAQKPQTPIVAKLVYVWCVVISAQVEFAFLSNSNAQVWQKGYISPLENTPK
jgi:hypothetical protein